LKAKQLKKGKKKNEVVERSVKWAVWELKKERVKKGYEMCKEKTGMGRRRIKQSDRVTKSHDFKI